MFMKITNPMFIRDGHGKMFIATKVSFGVNLSHVTHSFAKLIILVLTRFCGQKLFGIVER